MAEIKSSLEIALERAAAIGGGKEDLRREEGEGAGRSVGRKILNRDLAPAELAAALAALDEAARGYARREAARVLVEGLEQTPEPALAGLAALAGAEHPALAELRQRVAALEGGLRELEAELAAELGAELARAGIGGPAARPNPKAHPAYAERAAAATAGARQAVEAAGRDLLAALA